MVFVMARRVGATMALNRVAPQRWSETLTTGVCSAMLFRNKGNSVFWKALEQCWLFFCLVVL